MFRAGALFNAVKKQFGLHSYLLRLALPTPSPSPVPVPTLIPRLPPPVSNDDAESSKTKGSLEPVLNALRMDEEDIQHTARFTREFVVQSLVPWMEKCVNDWNEIVHFSDSVVSDKPSLIDPLYSTRPRAVYPLVCLPLPDASSVHHHLPMHRTRLFLRLSPRRDPTTTMARKAQYLEPPPPISIDDWPNLQPY